MEGVEVTENALMTEEEKQILDIYDRLEELELNIALLKAQGVLSQNEPAIVSEEEISTARNELLKAKAAYQVRSNIIESVLIANPIMNSVHAGTNASVIEQLGQNLSVKEAKLTMTRDMLPLLEKRDELSLSLTVMAKKELDLRDELVKIEAENIVIARRNAELAAEMLHLANAVSSQSKDDISDPEVRQQLDRLEAAMKTSRHRWRIMKGTASATIAGSGVDWSRDPKLLQMVLDYED